MVLPAGCLASTAIGAGAISAATTDRNCEVAVPIASASAASSSPFALTASCLPSRRLPTGEFVDPFTIHAPDAFAAQAVAAALTAVSRDGRYVAEGNGPVDFDCSGLTAWAWRQAGVSLVDLSYTQRDQTQDIPRSMVQPGDLVFWFGGDVHHVAIVVGVDGGQITIAEAANPESGIRTRLLGGGWDEAYLSGFGRVVRG
jgi:cell wall-associated NlpC family hydrolase